MTYVCSHCGEEIGTDLTAHMHNTRDSVGDLFESVKARAEGCDCDLEVRFHEPFLHTMVVHDRRCSMRNRGAVAAL